MGRIGCVRCEKSKRDFVARTFSLIAPAHTILHQVSCSYETITNAPKHNETFENISLGSNGVDWVGSFRKILTWLCGTNFCINCTSSPYFAPNFMQMIPNAPKHYETHQNMSLWYYGVDLVCSLWEILKRLGGTNFCIHCTSLAHFAPSFVQQWNDPKSTQTLWNAPKHEFTVRWCGSGGFVAKNSNAALWHELLH